MKIYPRKYDVPQGQRRCCIQCGRTCRTKTGKITRVYLTITAHHPPSKYIIVSQYEAPMIVCRTCFIGGFRKNSLGGIRLYDSFSGQPYDEYGMIPVWSVEFDDPWKAKK